MTGESGHKTTQRVLTKAKTGDDGCLVGATLDLVNETLGPFLELLWNGGREREIGSGRGVG